MFVMNSLIRSVHRPFDIADHRIDPSKSLHRNTRGAAPGDDSRMLASRLGNSSKAGQPIRNHNAIGAKMALGPLGDLFGAETVDYIHSHGHRVALLVDGYSRHKGCFVGRASTPFTAPLFTAPIHVIQLDDTGKWLAVIAFLHDPHQLVFDAPGGVVGNAQLATQ